MRNRKDTVCPHYVKKGAPRLRYQATVRAQGSAVAGDGYGREAGPGSMVAGDGYWREAVQGSAVAGDEYGREAARWRVVGEGYWCMNERLNEEPEGDSASKRGMAEGRTAFGHTSFGQV